MKRLIEGHKHFLAEVFPGKRQQFHLLAEMQAPEWLFITCSDSRVLPDLFLGTGPGDLFITRNAGNIVPITGYDVDGVTATIEYAVEVLKVRHAILCGHSDCGALKASLNPAALEHLPKAQRWLSHTQAALSPPPAAQSGRWRQCGVSFPHSRQRDCATAQPASATLRSQSRSRRPALSAWVVLRHSQRTHRAIRRRITPIRTAGEVTEPEPGPGEPGPETSPRIFWTTSCCPAPPCPAQS